MVHFRTPIKSIAKQDWKKIKADLETENRKYTSEVWLMGNPDDTSYYYINTPHQSIIWSIFWSGDEAIEAQKYLEECKSHTYIYYDINEDIQLVWRGGKTIEIFYRNGLVSAHSFGYDEEHINSKMTIQDFKKQIEDEEFISYVTESVENGWY